MSAVLARARRLILAGVLLVLPLVITVWVVTLIFGLVNSTVSRVVARVLALVGVEDLSAPVWAIILPLTGLLVSVALLLGIGLLGSHYVGRRMLASLEQLILSVPLVRAVYGGAKQLIGAFSSGGKGAFRDVVALEYPRRGVWVIGFVTSTFPAWEGVPAGETMVNVFVPTTPNPTSGFLFVVASSEVRRLDLSVEDAIKMIVSGGLVIPPRLAGGEVEAGE